MIETPASDEHLDDTLLHNLSIPYFSLFVKMPSYLLMTQKGEMISVYIDAVHFERDSYGYEYIAKLKWTNDFSLRATNECTKRDMIDFINQNPNCTKTKYFSYGYWCEGEDVRVVDNRYLRTDSNNIKADNLGSLPRY